MQKDCVFCKIVNREIPSRIEHEDDFCLCFRDINPRAKTHLLLIPKKHISTVKDLAPGDEKAMGALFMAASAMGAKFGLENYKLIVSVGEKAGQEVFHIHMHLMSAPD